MYLHYIEQLGYLQMPTFILKYLKTPSLMRLKNIGYFCGMDYASKEIYNFKEHISRYDHSLTVSLLVYKLTKNKLATLAGLFHDVATPCFSHVIDYMNQDYERQESTEEYTELILRNDTYLNLCLKEDGINIEDIINFKKYTIVDNERPKVCADRLDGIILTAIGWTKNINNYDIKKILEDLNVFKNEYNEEEIGFKTYSIAKNVLDVSSVIDEYCHSKEDNYMMNLLALITRLAINKKYITYKQLYYLSEKSLFELLKNQNDKSLRELLNEFQTKKLIDIPEIDLPKVKIRDLNPLVNGKRLK